MTKRQLLLLLSLLLLTQTVCSKTIYLNTGGTGLWSADGVNKFAVWYWGDATSGAWSKMMTHVKDNYYRADIADGNAYLLFVRFDNSVSTPDWNAKRYNQTEDQQYGRNDCFTVTAWGDEKSTGDWSDYLTGNDNNLLPDQNGNYLTQAPRHCPDIMLQAFYWDSYTTEGKGKFYGDTRWTTLNSQVCEIAESFDLVWLPPSALSTGGTGYIPKQYSNQNSDWGTAEELHTLIDNLHQGGTKVVADIVINHAVAREGWCNFYDMDFGSYGHYYPDASWITNNDEMNYDDAAGACKGKGTGGWDDGYGDEQNYGPARDWAHDKHEVREMFRAYLKWMKNSVGYDGWRYDYCKGFHASHENDYNRNSGAYFSVCEYWDGQSNIENFLNDASYNTYMFDFPSKYKINTGIGDGNYNDLLCSGLVCAHPDNAVLFVDNHDTFCRDRNGELTDNGGFMGCYSIGNYQNRTVQAYAFILSMPGVPCVFYPHWYSFKPQIKALCDARHRAGIHSGSKVQDEAGNNYYKATITGSNGGSIKLFIGPDSNYGNCPAGYKKAYVGENCGVYYVQRSNYKEKEQTTEATVVHAATDNTLYIYSLTGILIKQAPADFSVESLPAGAYILRQENKSRKVLIGY